MCLHKPSFEEEEEVTEGNQSWFDRTRGSVIHLRIPSVLFFNVLDHRCCATCWGRDLQIGLQLMSLKDLPTLIRVPAFIEKKDNTNKDSTGFGSPGSLKTIQQIFEKCLKIF